MAESEAVETKTEDATHSMFEVLESDSVELLQHLLATQAVDPNYTHEGVHALLLCKSTKVSRLSPFERICCICGGRWSSV